MVTMQKDQRATLSILACPLNVILRNNTRVQVLVLQVKFSHSLDYKSEILYSNTDMSDAVYDEHPQTG